MKNEKRAHNPKSQIPTIFSTFFKSQKWSAQNEAIFGGQNQKNAKKNFIVPNRSLGHTDHLYTYKGHVEHVGFM